jgi:hypothetical protein
MATPMIRLNTGMGIADDGVGGARRSGAALRKRTAKRPHPTSSKISARRSGMSTITSWPQSTSKVRQAGSDFFAA